MFDSSSNLTARPVRGLLQILQEGVTTLFHVLLFSLLVLGLGGLVYKALRPEGWIEASFGQIWSQNPTMAIMTALAALVAALWVKRFFEHLPMFGKRGDILVYSCLALGLFFAFKLVVTGSLCTLRTVGRSSPPGASGVARQLQDSLKQFKQLTSRFRTALLDGDWRSVGSPCAPLSFSLHAKRPRFPAAFCVHPGLR
jgi:hypothetical protein